MYQFEGIAKNSPCTGPNIAGSRLAVIITLFSNVPRPRNVFLPLALNENEDLIPTDSKNIFGQEPIVLANK